MFAFGTGTYISSSFQKSPGTGHMVAQAGFVQWGDMVDGHRVHVIPLNRTGKSLKGEQKVLSSHLYNCHERLI